jgi:hypothetical protein
MGRVFVEKERGKQNYTFSYVRMWWGKWNRKSYFY